MDCNKRGSINYHQGEEGEKAVADLLPNAIWTRKIDIVWGKRTIEVRTSRAKSGNSFHFAAARNTDAEVVIFLAIENKEVIHSWVIPVKSLGNRKSVTLNPSKKTKRFKKFYVHPKLLRDKIEYIFKELEN